MVRLPSAYEEVKPWDCVFFDAAKDDMFWDEQVEKPALRFTSHATSAREIRDDGLGTIRGVNDFLRRRSWTGSECVGVRASAAASEAKGSTRPVRYLRGKAWARPERRRVEGRRDARAETE